HLGAQELRFFASTQRAYSRRPACAYRQSLPMAQITNLPMTSTNAPAPLSPKAEGYANDYTAEPMKIVSSLETSPGSKLRATAPVFLPKQFQVECEKKLYTEEDDLASPTSKDPGSPSSVMSRTGTRVHFPPGLEPPDDTPSHGSSLHASGLCRRAE
ncbi:unnamed protein product, partial [Durusdinium trenchii]